MLSCTRTGFVRVERVCWEFGEEQEDRRGEKLNHRKAHRVVDVGFEDPSTVSVCVLPNIGGWECCVGFGTDLFSAVGVYADGGGRVRDVWV